MNSSVYRRAVDLLEADVGDEVVALDPAKGQCFGFNSPAAVVWRELAEPKSVDELRECLLAQFDVSLDQCSDDLDELLQDMTNRNLIERI